MTGVTRKQATSSESGFALLLVFAMAAAVAIMLYMELPRIVFESQRTKEQELIDRGEEYRRAIQLYVRKNKKYPASLDDLDKSGSIRYLRRRYKDPMTGESDWRLIHIDAAGVFTDSLTIKPPEKDKEEKAESANTFITEGAAFGATGPAEGQQGGAAGIRGASDRPRVSAAAGAFGQAQGAPGQPQQPPIVGQGQPYYPGQQAPGQPFPGQQAPGQPYYPGQQVPGQPYQAGGQQQPGSYPYQQPVQGQTYPGVPIGQTQQPGLPPSYYQYAQPNQPQANQQQPGQPQAYPNPQPGQVQQFPVPGQVIPYGQIRPGQPQQYVNPQTGQPVFPFPQPGQQQAVQPGQSQPTPGGVQIYPGAQPVTGQPQPYPFLPPGLAQANPNAQNQGNQQQYPQPYTYPQQGVAGAYGQPVQQQPVPRYPQSAASSQTGGVVPTPYAAQPGTTNRAAGGTAQGPSPALELIRRMLTTPRPGGLQGTAGQASGQVIGGGIAGVASKTEDEGIKVYNERTKYNEWEFIYDVRQEQAASMAAAAGAAMAGGAASQAGGNPMNTQSGQSTFGSSTAQPQPSPFGFPQPTQPVQGVPVQRPPAPFGRTR
jgi:hypothetical protein